MLIAKHDTEEVSTSVCEHCSTEWRCYELIQASQSDKQVCLPFRKITSRSSQHYCGSFPFRSKTPQQNILPLLIAVSETLVP